jgi:hypothetical protein
MRWGSVCKCAGGYIERSYGNTSARYQRARCNTSADRSSDRSCDTAACNTDRVTSISTHRACDRGGAGYGDGKRDSSRANR